MCQRLILFSIVFDLLLKCNRMSLKVTLISGNFTGRWAGNGELNETSV